MFLSPCLSPSMAAQTSCSDACWKGLYCDWWGELVAGLYNEWNYMLHVQLAWSGHILNVNTIFTYLPWSVITVVVLAVDWKRQRHLPINIMQFASGAASEEAPGGKRASVKFHPDKWARVKFHPCKTDVCSRAFLIELEFEPWNWAKLWI